MGSDDRLTHLMRLGVHAEQQFFVGNQDYFDVVLFNANLAHYFASGTASLIVGKLKKPFIIDPITHAYCHHPRYIRAEGSKEKPGPVKASLAGLANDYGDPITSILDERQLLPTDFQSTKQAFNFAERVLNFQNRGLINALDPSDAKYMDGDIEGLLKPLFLIAPYFYMKGSDVWDWLPINLDMIRFSRDIVGKDSLFAEIVIDRGLLDSPEELNKIAKSYRDLDSCDGYLLWISDHPEHNSALSTLRGLRALTATLAETGRQVINLYGGYYSLLLSHFGMTGVCHGPGYGEDRDVIPVGGGMPTSKFYLTPVHQRMLFRDVQFMVAAGAWTDEDEYFNEVCSGATCQDVLSSGLRDNFYKFGEEIVREGDSGRSYSFPTPQARVLTTNHYLEAKAQEFRAISELGLKQLLAQISESKKKYEPLMPGAKLRYLDSWVEAIKE